VKTLFNVLRPDPFSLGGLIGLKERQQMAFLQHPLLVEQAIKVVFILQKVFASKDDFELA